MKINCIAVDDEPLALTKMKDYIEKVEFLHLKALIGSGVEAASYLRKEKVDLIFLDIQMHDLNGIGLMKTLKTPPIVILTTAYEEYALEGYEYNVCDYLLKPISFMRFMKAVNLAAETFLAHNLTFGMQFNGGNKTTGQDHIFIKTTNKLQKVYFDDILYIEAMKDYVKIKTTRDLFISLYNMKNFLQKLPSARFVRIHKSYAIAMDKIDALKKNSVEIAGTDIPVGQTFRAVLNDLIRQ